MVSASRSIPKSERKNELKNEGTFAKSVPGHEDDIDGVERVAFGRVRLEAGGILEEKERRRKEKIIQQHWE